MRYAGYRYFVIGIFFMLLLFGTFVGCRYIIKLSEADKIREDAVSVVNNEEENSDEVNIYEGKEEEKIDITVVYEDFYSLCEETVEKEEVYYSTTLAKVKENELKKQEKEDVKYSIVEEGEDLLVFKRTLQTNCPNHFRIKLENSNITIYRKLTDKEFEIYKKLSVSEGMIREELKERLKEGVDVNSKEELNLFIEDVES